MNPMIVEPVVLSGNFVRLEPLKIDHVQALARVGLEPELWRWIPARVTTPEEMRAYVMTALDEQRQGMSLPFVIVERAGDQVAGCTRFGNIQRAHHRLEIGWTWITPAYQRTAVNTEAKLLLLTHAFERLGAMRVELKTDALNEKSRRAILRIGAIEEGTFRKHMLTASGRCVTRFIFPSSTRSGRPSRRDCRAGSPERNPMANEKRIKEIPMLRQAPCYVARFANDSGAGRISLGPGRQFLLNNSNYCL